MDELIYVFEQTEYTHGEQWDAVIQLAHPDDLLYAAWAYLLESDSYHIDVIFENNADDGSSIDNMVIGTWVDQFYMSWVDRIYKIKQTNSAYELESWKITQPHNDIFIKFRLKGTSS